MIAYPFRSKPSDLTGVSFYLAFSYADGTSADMTTQQPGVDADGPPGAGNRCPSDPLDTSAGRHGLGIGAPPPIITEPKASDGTPADSNKSAIDSSPRLMGGGRFFRDSRGNVGRSESQSPFRLTMPSLSPGQLAFSAMQYLPVPVIILNDLKTVVLANEAMGRMMGLVTDDSSDEDAATAVERLRGQSLSQVGIDMLQDGRPLWVTWESFLESLVQDLGVRPPVHDHRQHPQSAGESTPTLGSAPPLDRRQSPSGRSGQDATIEVVISRRDLSKTTFDSRYKSKESEYQSFAKMIVTVWEVEDKQTYFTLTFTNTQSTPSQPPNNKKPVARSSTLEAADRKSIANSNTSSVASSRESSSPSFHTPGVVTMAGTPFPPLGPPSIASHSSSPSLLQKIIMMKDALLDNTQMPILAMWKDGSVIFPNKATRQLLPPDSDLDSTTDGFELLKNWKVYTEDFSRCLEVEEYPICTLVRTEQPFASLRVGMYDLNGKKILFDVLGEAIRDDTTGEFLAGVITGRDVTVMQEEISQIRERDDERFKLICDTMPQLVWTATPEGLHDFFNTRWYTYTGLKPEECLGLAWQSPFHPDDKPEALARWINSLKTGNPYQMEYRCRSKDGEWRWFLGRALAVRNKETGEIEKWFGACPRTQLTISR